MTRITPLQERSDTRGLRGSGSTASQASKEKARLSGRAIDSRCRSGAVLASVHRIVEATSHSPTVQPTRDLRKGTVLLLLATAAYAVAYLLWFWGTPLGEVPVLDGRENIA